MKAFFRKTILIGLFFISSILIACSGSSGDTSSLNPPTVSIISPTESNISTKPNIQLLFNQKMNIATISSANIELSDSNNNVIALNNIIQGTNNSFVTTPIQQLQDNTLYYMTVSKNIQSSAGLFLPKTVVFSFVTGDNSAP